MQTRVLVLFASLVLSAAAVVRANRHELPTSRTAFDAFPVQFGDWRELQRTTIDEASLKVLAASDYLTRTYVAVGERTPVDLYIGYWSSQRQGETIHSPQNCLPGSGWQPVSRSTIEVPDPRNPNGPRLPMNRYEIEKGSDRDLVLYWFQSQGRAVASEYWSKFYLVADALRHNRSDGALVRVLVPITGEAAGSGQRTEAVALRFVKDLVPQLGDFLPN